MADKNFNITNNHTRNDNRQIYDSRSYTTRVNTFSWSFGSIFKAFAFVILFLGFLNVAFVGLNIPGINSTLLEKVEHTFMNYHTTIFRITLNDYLVNLSDKVDIAKIFDVMKIPSLDFSDFLQGLKSIGNILIAIFKVFVILPVQMINFVFNFINALGGINADFLNWMNDNFDISWITM